MHCVHVRVTPSVSYRVCLCPCANRCLLPPPVTTAATARPRSWAWAAARHRAAPSRARRFTATCAPTPASRPFPGQNTVSLPRRPDVLRRMARLTSTAGCHQLFTCNQPNWTGCSEPCPWHALELQRVPEQPVSFGYPVLYDVQCMRPSPPMLTPLTPANTTLPPSVPARAPAASFTGKSTSASVLQKRR